MDIQNLIFDARKIGSCREDYLYDQYYSCLHLWTAIFKNQIKIFEKFCKISIYAKSYK